MEESGRAELKRPNKLKLSRSRTRIPYFLTKYGLIWRFAQAFWRTRVPNCEFSISCGCLGVYGKLLILRIAQELWLYKPPCKKIFFLRFAQFFLNIFFKVTLGQICWSNSSSAMVLEYIKWRKNLKQCFM